RHAYDEHINAVMIQNDVLGTAKLEGLMEGRAEGIAKGREEGRAEGIAEGRAEGRAEGIADVAKAMLENGMDIDKISRLTSLSIDEIRNLHEKS
ncbi:MAG: hypothetical protein K2H97_03005, partial [Prevotella sp.]|nr:hypothetical protein [Prevotella sp.]